MAKVTSKLQLTIPKLLAVKYEIRPGDEVALMPAGECIRIDPRNRRKPEMDMHERLRLFAEMLRRQRRREKGHPEPRSANARAAAERGWKREDLYTRGGPR
jgi:bifunctional DNA-binding transcriptional regulator/antitoxin component of YhaV-PrlF toxin-antitoxin module